MEKETTLINIHHEIDRDDYIYIGRAGQGHDGYFGNPFKDGTRAQNIRAFTKYFNDRIKSDPEFKRRVLELRGKTLGCFCHPQPCHGNIIINYINNEKGKETTNTSKRSNNPKRDKKRSSKTLQKVRRNDHKKQRTTKRGRVKFESVKRTSKVGRRKV